MRRGLRPQLDEDATPAVSPFPTRTRFHLPFEPALLPCLINCNRVCSTRADYSIPSSLPAARGTSPTPHDDASLSRTLALSLAHSHPRTHSQSPSISLRQARTATPCRRACRTLLDPARIDPETAVERRSHGLWRLAGHLDRVCELV